MGVATPFGVHQLPKQNPAQPFHRDYFNPKGVCQLFLYILLNFVAAPQSLFLVFVQQNQQEFDLIESTAAETETK